jgi:hypothetical protein
MNGETVSLHHLPEEAEQAIITAALAGIAEGPATSASCRAALALAQRRAGEHERPRLHPELFGRLLVGFLGTLPEPGSSRDHEAMALVADLIDAAGLPAKTDIGLQVEDLVWQRIAPFTKSAQPLPPGLRDVAERLGFATGRHEGRQR